jgi:hypothetical protein
MSGRRRETFQTLKCDLRSSRKSEIWREIGVNAAVSAELRTIKEM